MAVYSLSSRIGTVVWLGANVYGPLWELQTSALANSRITELTISNFTAQASSYGIGRPSVVGTAYPGLFAFQPEDPGSAPAMSAVALSWTIPPAAPATFFRRWSVGSGTAGTVVMSVFPKGIVVPASSSVALYASGAAVSVTVIADVNCTEVE